MRHALKVATAAAGAFIGAGPEGTCNKRKKERLLDQLKANKK